MVQSHVRFNRVPEKVAGKVWEAGAEPGQFNRVKFNRVPEKVPVTHKPNC